MHLKVLTCVLALGLPAGAMAQASGSAPSTDKPKQSVPAAKSAPEQSKEQATTRAMSETERRAVFDLHKLNEAEMAVGKLAANKAQSQDVKRYAEHLSSDHKESQNKVLALAKRRNVRLNALTPTHEQTEQAKQDKALLQRLRATPPHEFDQAFTNAMVEGHRKAIERVQQALSKCEDAELQVLLQDTLPSLSQHMQAAQRLSTAEPAPAPITPPVTPPVVQ